MRLRLVQNLPRKQSSLSDPIRFEYEESEDDSLNSSSNPGQSKSRLSISSTS